MTIAHKSSLSLGDTDSLIPSTTKRHSNDSTHVIPSPGSAGKPFKRYEPFLTKLVVIIGVPLLMIALGLALEISIFISNKNDGFKVPQSNVFTVSPEFLASFFPTLVVIPFAIAWRQLDEYLRRYEPYIVLNKGNAEAEESLLLDYIALGRVKQGRNFFTNHLLTLFRSLNYNHRVIFLSSLTAILTYIYQPLGSIFLIQQRPRTSDVVITSTKTIGLSTNIYDLKAFVAAAGYVDSSVLLNISDPPFVHMGWATAPFDIAADQYLNGSLTVETTGIQTSVNCFNPSEPPTLTPVGTKNFSLSSKSVDGCVQSVSFDVTGVTDQYGVSDVACPGNASRLDSSLRPVMFWFFHTREDNNRPEAQTIFCAPTIQARNIQAVANLNDGLMANISAIGDILPQNNVTSAGGVLNGSAYNGLIFDNITDPFTGALAVATRSLVPAAIFHNAEQLPIGPQNSAFDLPDGFLNLTTTLYTRYLSISALYIYFLPTSTPLHATVVSLIPSLKIAPVPAHILATTLILTGFIGIFLQVISWQKRKQLLLAAPPGSIASAIALTSRSGFGERLVPYDDELALKEKLDGLRFRLDKRTGAILADEIETTSLKRPQNRDSDDAASSFRTWSMLSSSDIARATADAQT